ncbi:MAG: hypothetical protein ACOH2A_05870 [Sphingobacteriaceae bacterium]
MKKFIIIAVVLFIAVIALAALYFSALQPRKQGTEKVMNLIPTDAAMIFEYNNDKSFYDIFKNNTLFSSLIGDENTTDLTYLRDHLLAQKSLLPYFMDQRIFISLHPKLNVKQVTFLISSSTIEYKDPEELQKTLTENKAIKVTPMTFNGKSGFRLDLSELGKSFFLLFDGRLTAGSFSRELVEDAALHAEKPAKKIFTRLSDQQILNAVASLYINYNQLPALLDQLFKNNRADLFLLFRSLPGTAALSLNYKTDALMFNGFTTLDTSFSSNYFGLFLHQKPFNNSLKDIFPYTTAYSISFAVADPHLFQKDLKALQQKQGLQNKKTLLFNQVKSGTGVDLETAFNQLLGNEFAVLTTDRQEKIGVIGLKNGSNLKPFLANISKPALENIGHFDFEELPYYLLGDAFKVFKTPYYTILDNNLILANSSSTLSNYLKIYSNRDFLNARAQYREFDALQAEQSNISFFIHIKNAMPMIKGAFRPAFNEVSNGDGFDWKNYYAASYQFTSSDDRFYTNLYFRYEEKPDGLKNP